MNKNGRIILFAGLLVLALFSLPLWLPSLIERAQAQKAEKPASTDALILLDGGWFTGQTQYHVIAVPQVLAWKPGSDKAIWATETGFLYGGVLNESGTRLYLIEHRKLGVDSLRDQTFSDHELYKYNKGWGVFLTKLDPNTGRVINRSQLPDPPYKSYSDISLLPLAVKGDTLYIMNYATKNNFFAYDMRAGKFAEQAWTTCEHGYLMRAIFIESSNSVASLCTDYADKPISWITHVSLDTNETQTVEIPALGDDDFETGNGLILTPGGDLLVIDTDAGVIATVDVQTLQITKTVNYLASLPKQQGNLQQRAIDWLLDLSAQPAYAKGWMGLSAISPDGQTLAVDSGLGNVATTGGKPGVVTIDLQTLQAEQLIELSSTPSRLAFASDGGLSVFFEKNNPQTPLRGLYINLATGEQSSISLKLNGWLHSILVH